MDAPSKLSMENQIVELENSFWTDQATMQRSYLQTINVIWLGWTLFQMGFDVLQRSVHLGLHPKIIHLRSAADCYLPLVCVRLAILLILVYAKWTGFFSGHHHGGSTYLTSPARLTFGIFAIQILEFAAAVITVDPNTGVHCTWMLIIFNYTPIRVGYKSPLCFIIICIFTLVQVSFFGVVKEDYKMWISGDVGNEVDEGGVVHTKDVNLKIMLMCLACMLFWCFQSVHSFAREKSLVANHVGILFGKNQEICLGETKKKNQELLNSMLPPEVSNNSNLSNSNSSAPLTPGAPPVRTAPNVESYLDVTVLFCMIDEFPTIAKNMNASEIVQILNIVYSEFDKLVDDAKIYKVETIGEVYMMAAGCPRRSVWHAEYAADMALLMVRAIPRIRVKLRMSVLKQETLLLEEKEKEERMTKVKIFENFNVKVGLNTGGVTAGVIGDTCQRFKLFGDTVNTASRMESNSHPGFIMTSESTFKILVKSTLKHYNFKKRELITIKGKGTKQCYFLVGDNAGNYSEDFHTDLHLGDNQFSLSRRIAEIQKEERDSEEGGNEAQRDQLLEMLDMNQINDDRDFGSAEYASLSQNINHALSGSMTNAEEHAFSWEKEVQLRKKLTSRDFPQLAISRALLLVFGQDMKFIKPEGIWDIWLETSYTQQVFFKERQKVRRYIAAMCLIFTCIFMNDMGLIQGSGAGKKSAIAVMIRGGIQIPATAAFYVYTHTTSFFHYQQQMLTTIWFFIGVSIIAFSLYEAPDPGHTFLLIIVHLIFQMELMQFVSRMILCFLLVLMYGVFAYVNCSSYGEGIFFSTSTPQFNLTQMGNIMCCVDSITNGTGMSSGSGVDDPCSLMWSEYDINPWHDSDIIESSPWSTASELIVENFLYTEIAKVQLLVPKTITYHLLLLLLFVGLSVTPAWMSNYFSRVSHKLTVEVERRKLEIEKVNEKNMKQMCLLLPPSVVNSLQSDDLNFAELYSNITILFVDMVGFTKFSAQLDPDELVMFLNHMYTKFDVVLERFSLYKVEIIGDALFAVSGCPSELADACHASRALCAAHGLLEQIELICEELELDVRIRIGVHSGESVAGVVGSKDPRFHLFGETVNCAEKVESTGKAGQVHCSEATRRSVLESSNPLIPGQRYNEMFDFERREEKNVEREMVGATAREIADVKESIAKAAGAVGKSYFATLTRPLATYSFVQLKLKEPMATKAEASDLMKSSRTSGKKKHKTSRRTRSGSEGKRASRNANKDTSGVASGVGSSPGGSSNSIQSAGK